MASKSIRHTNNDPGGRLTNEEYSAVIDAWAGAVYAATSELRPPTAEQLVRATGDLLNALSERSTRLVTGAFTPVLEHLEQIERQLGELERRFDRRQQSNADITVVLRDIQTELRDHGQRIRALERAVGDGGN